jgi:hypothetical protein
MVLGGASVALAHGNEPAADPSPFLADNAVAKSGLANAKGPMVTATYTLPDGSLLEDFSANRGIAQGYFVHSPTCVLHPGLSH